MLTSSILDSLSTERSIQSSLLLGFLRKWCTHFHSLSLLLRDHTCLCLLQKKTFNYCKPFKITPSAWGIWLESAALRMKCGVMINLTAILADDVSFINLRVLFPGTAATAAYTNLPQRGKGRTPRSTMISTLKPCTNSAQRTNRW